TWPRSSTACSPTASGTGSMHAATPRCGSSPERPTRSWSRGRSRWRSRPEPAIAVYKPLLARHLGSGREAAHWPARGLPEYCFIGRSNVGKSSLINMLCGIGKLARVSNTPGRTRMVEHFRVEGTLTSRSPWLLADLPGYGFAKASKSDREAWRRMVHTY